jgi:hypothetical protein
MVPMEAKDCQPVLVWLLENMSPDEAARAVQQACTKRADDAGFMARNDPMMSDYWARNALKDSQRWGYLAKAAENARIAIQTVDG